MKTQLRRLIARKVYGAYHSLLKAVEAQRAPAGTCDGLPEGSWFDNAADLIAEAQPAMVALGWSKRQRNRISENLLAVTGA